MAIFCSAVCVVFAIRESHSFSNLSVTLFSRLSFVFLFVSSVLSIHPLYFLFSPPPSSNRLPLSLFLPLFPVSLSVCRSLLGLPINLLYVNITLYFRGRKISRKVNLKYFLEKIFSRKYLPAKISSRENILSRKNLPAKISSRENIFRRFFLCRKYVGW